MAKESAPYAPLHLELAEACDRLTRALKAEATFQRKGNPANLEELRRLRQKVDSASESYLEKMRQFVEFFQNGSNGE